MKLLKKFANVLLSIICLVCILFIVAVAVGYKPVTIMSASMSPTINVGDLCFIHSKDSYREGNIVTFTVEDEYITHRIECDNGDGTFITKGDANKTVDVLNLSEGQIVGKVGLTIPKMGYLLNFLGTMWGGIAVVAIMVAIIFIDAIATKGAMKEEEVEEEEENLLNTSYNKDENGAYYTAESFILDAKNAKNLDTLSYEEKVEYARDLFREASEDGDILTWWNKQHLDVQRDLGYYFLGDGVSVNEVTEFFNSVLNKL